VKSVSFSFFIILIMMTSVCSKASYEGAVSTGLGGTGVASVDPLESQLLNPSALVHLRGMTFGVGSNTAYYDLQNKSYAWHLTFFENSVDSQIPSGFGYIQENGIINDISYTHRDFYISAAEFLGPYVALGLSGKQRSSVYSVETLDSETQAFTQMNGTLGLLFTPSVNLGFGFTASNFINNQAEIPNGLRLSRTFGLGTTYIFADFLRFRLDYLWPIVKSDEVSPSIHGGFESFFTEWVAFRAGVTKKTNISDINYSIGLGFIGPRFQINYGYEELKTLPKQSQHSFDLVLPFW
jgi:hypothetical protein